MQAIVTDLVFEHALRIRVKAGTAESVDQDEGEASDATVVGTPDSQEAASQDGGATTNAADGSSTPGSTATKGKGKATSKSEDAKVDRVEKNVHLMGRINNLVSSDLQNLNDLSMMIIFWSTSSLCLVSLIRHTHLCTPPVQRSRCRSTFSSALSSCIKFSGGGECKCSVTLSKLTICSVGSWGS